MRTNAIQSTASRPVLQPDPAVHARDAVTEADLTPLPEPARRWLRAVGVLGRPRDRSFRLAWKGRFRLRVGSPWSRCEARQYNTGPEIRRDFRMRVWVAALLPIHGHDLYAHGHGRMLVRAFDLFRVADARGPEFDMGELVTWLDDAVMFAPSMLLVPAVAWAAVDAGAFDVELRDHGLRVGGRVSVDERGVLPGFTTHDRWCENPIDRRRMIRAQWRTPVDRWDVVDGRTVPAGGRAIWDLPQGEFAYADLRVVPGSLAWNVPPADQPSE